MELKEEDLLKRNVKGISEKLKKAEFSKINIKNTDKIEIVCFVGGG